MTNQISLVSNVLTAGLLGLLLMLQAPSLAHAESVVWTNNTIPDLIAIGSDGADRATVSMFNIGVTVQYRATPWLVDSAGAKVRPLQSGENLMVGERVLFEFSAHAREDISWFGQGGAYDTPYGTWFDGIVPESVTDPVLAPTLIFEWISNDIAQGKYAAGDKGGADANSVALSIGKPTKQVTVSGAGAQCASQGNSNQLCTFTTTGAVTGQFEFNATLGEFFAAWADTKKNWKPKRAPVAMTLRADFKKSAGDFDLMVPVQTIPFTLTVIEPPPDNQSPASPALSVTSGASCVVGTPHSISMTATDPDEDSLHYLIDWNADGVVDQIVPPSGYVPSGTTQTASRTYATEGSKTVKVKAEDVHGLTSQSTLTSVTSNPLGVSDNQVFTSSGTWTKPTGVNPDQTVTVEMWGGGGSGWDFDAYGGGGGGAYNKLTLRAGDLPTSVLVTVGAGGTPSKTGGTSSFGSYGSANGGASAKNSSAGVGGVSSTSGYAGGNGGNGGAFNTRGNSSTYGGGGGGGASDSGCIDKNNGGASTYGGSGGGCGTTGSIPGGGGGASGDSDTQGAGARGEVRVRMDLAATSPTPASTPSSSSSWATLIFTCTDPGSQGSGVGSDLGGDGYGGGSGGDGGVTSNLTIRAIPSLVRRGNTTRVHWSAQNVQSCIISAPNGDSWTGASSPLGGETSRPIIAETAYTLSCLDLNGATKTKQATVRILPNWQEK